MISFAGQVGRGPHGVEGCKANVRHDYQATGAYQPCALPPVTRRRVVACTLLPPSLELHCLLRYFLITWPNPTPCSPYNPPSHRNARRTSSQHVFTTTAPSTTQTGTGSQALITRESSMPTSAAATCTAPCCLSQPTTPAPYFTLPTNS